MMIYDLILSAARIGTSWTKRAARTHQALGLGIGLNSAIALTDYRPHDQSERSRPLRLQEETSLKQHELEQECVAIQHHDSEEDYAALTKHDSLEPGPISENEANLPTLAANTALQLAKVSEGRTLSDAPTCHKKHNSQTACQSTNILLGVALTDSPSLEAWVRRYAPNEDQIKLSNVSFEACTQSDFTLSSACEFQNVTFINCRFKGTAFTDVRLHDVTFRNCVFNSTTFLCVGLYKNVTFSNVNFKDTTLYWTRLYNVTVSQLRLKHAVWRNFAIQTASINNGCLVRRLGKERGYGFRVTSPTSKAIQHLLNIEGQLSLDDLKKKLCRDGDWARDIHLRIPGRRGKILSRLAEHEDIIDRIMRYCFPGKSTHIFEYPAGVSIPRRKSTKLYRASWGRQSGYSTIYFGSLQSETPLKADVPAKIPPRGVGNCTSLLLVNKQFKALALKHMYNRTFHLQCSAEGAREFLVAHAEEMQVAKQLVLYYHWASEKLVLHTDINAWRYLLGTVRHNFSSIPNVRLHVGKYFWTHIDTSLDPTRLVSDYFLDSNPLVEAYKFAAPDDRWRIKGDQSTHRTSGTALQIDIEDTDTLGKDDFVRDMTDMIEKRRVGRPLFVRSPTGHEITYRCAREFR